MLEMASDDSLSEMPFYNISIYELIEHLFKMESVRHDICQNNSFHNNLISTCNSDILEQVEFSYCTDTEFNKLVHKFDGKVDLVFFTWI